jgi:selenocysteine lyase/cysteine desulfurase
LTERSLFDLPRGVAYLNCAYMAPQLRSVTEAGEAAVRRKGSPWTITSADFFDGTARLRASFAALVGADADGVAVIPSVSYGMGTAAANLPLPPGRTVLTLADEFPSNIYAWRALAERAGGTVVVVPRPGDHDWTAALLAGIDERTAVVAVPRCHWTDGTLVDLVAVGRACRAAGAALVVDLSQSLGAMPFDIAAVQPDVLVSVGYKWLLGPYSIGFAWFAPSLRDGRPLEQTWAGRRGSEDFAALVSYVDEYQPGARRYEMGESANFALTPMMQTALDQVLAWDPARIGPAIRPLTDRLVERASALGLTAAPAALRADHLTGLRATTLAPDLPARLAAADVHVSVRGDAIRVSPHLYNDETEIDRLVDVLAAAV